MPIEKHRKIENHKKGEVYFIDSKGKEYKVNSPKDISKMFIWCKYFKQQRRYFKLKGYIK